MKIRKEVKDFSKLMEEKLAENDHKGGWEDCNVHYLFNLLLKELSELHEAIYENEDLNVIDEAVDVANFSMMIADRIKKMRGE